MFCLQLTYKRKRNQICWIISTVLKTTKFCQRFWNKENFLLRLSSWVRSRECPSYLIATISCCMLFIFHFFPRYTDTDCAVVRYVSEIPLFSFFAGPEIFSPEINCWTFSFWRFPWDGDTQKEKWRKRESRKQLAPSFGKKGNGYMKLSRKGLGKLVCLLVPHFLRSMVC